MNRNYRSLLLGSLTLAMLAVARPLPVLADVQIYQQVLQSTAWVLTKNSGGTSSGTGVLVDGERRILVTNYHVVGDSRSAVVFFPDSTSGQPAVSRQHYLDNVRKLGVRGRIVAVDRKRDLALIELQKIPTNAQALALADKSIGPGEHVQSIGNPGSSEALWVFTSGTVRSVYKKKFRTGSGQHEFRVVETQSPINSGDSGGPVVNREGKLVAIAQAIAPKARLVSYCVDVSEVRALLSGPWKPAPRPIKEVLERAEMTFVEHDSSSLKIELEPSKDVKQTVFVSKDTEYFERADVRKIWAMAAATQKAPDAATTMKLLEQSARTKLGGWTVERSADGRYLIIYCAKVDATASPESVKSTMQYVARLTTFMKKELQVEKKQEDASDTLASWLKD